MPKYISHKKVIFRVFNHDIFLCGNYDQQPIFIIAMIR